MRVLTSTGMVTKQKDLLRFNFGQKSVYEDFEAILLSGSIEPAQVCGLEMSRTEHCTEQVYPRMAARRKHARRPKFIQDEESSAAMPSKLPAQPDPKNAPNEQLLAFPEDDCFAGSESAVQNLRLSRLTTTPRRQDLEFIGRQGSRTCDFTLRGDVARSDIQDKRHISERPNSTAGQLPYCKHIGTSEGRLKRKDTDRSSGELVHVTPKRRRLRRPSRERQRPRHNSSSDPGIRAVQAADEDDGCRYIRVGECVGDRAHSEDGIDMRSIVVAIVNPAVNVVGSQLQMVTYMAVDSYTINGISVGDYDSADRDISLAEANFRADRYWRDQVSIPKTQGAGRPGSSYHELDNAVIKYASQTPSGKRPRQGSRPRKTPVRPKHSLRSWSNSTSQSSHHKGEINAVIAFVNDVVDVDLGLPRNLQASLNYDESLASFKKYILDQKGAYGSIGWMLTDDRSPIDYWADVRIWVLPARRGRKSQKMFEWTESSAILAKDFLDSHSVQEYGRNLYIEVRIVEDPDARRKDEERTRRMALNSSTSADLGSRNPPSRKMVSARKWEKTWASSWRATTSRSVASHYPDKGGFPEPVNTAEKALGMRRDEWIDEDDEVAIMKVEPLVSVKMEDG